MVFSFPCSPGNFRNCKVTLLGLGQFGGGVAAARYLARQGAKVTVTDQASAEKLQDPVQLLRDLPIEKIRLGGHDQNDLEQAELLVVNPAVPPHHPWLKLARSRQIPVTTEVGLLWNELQRRQVKIAAVTGSNGKSTTTALLHSILNAEHGQAWSGGNSGGSLLPDLAEMQAGDWVVLELSSFQLHLLEPLEIAPDLAVVTNFSANHLDWHGSLEHYRASKQHLLRFQQASQIAVLNENDPDVATWKSGGTPVFFTGKSDSSSSCSPVSVSPVSVDGQQLVLPHSVSPPNSVPPQKKQVLPVQCWTSLRGEHHLANIAAAVTAALAVDVSSTSVETGLRQFQPLPHRLELIGEKHQRSFCNDSLATTPESAIAALNAFDQPIILLAGGADKGSDLTLFAQTILKQCKQTILMGATATELGKLLEAHASPNQRGTWQFASNFDQAFDMAWKESAPGDLILLSPGCASYGWFASFRERGEQFGERFRQVP